MCSCLWVQHFLRRVDRPARIEMLISLQQTEQGVGAEIGQLLISNHQHPWVPQHTIQVSEAVDLLQLHTDHTAWQHQLWEPKSSSQAK